ncbi:hypothetical protein ACFSO0_11910 [Brevibacillus sp. GCM10020057]|uniref:hypothetical protein n=1 Tax=Brevibacillus sp. GCM10020057 TaxID=3317327 RepID=UPI00362BF699
MKVFQTRETIKLDNGETIELTLEEKYQYHAFNKDKGEWEWTGKDVPKIFFRYKGVWVEIFFRPEYASHIDLAKNACQIIDEGGKELLTQRLRAYYQDPEAFPRKNKGE